MSTPLRTFVNDLLHDDAARSAFAADPASYLDDHGWSDLDGPDVGTALGALVDELPIDQAVRLHPVAVEADHLGADGLGAVAGLQAAAAAFAGTDDAAMTDPPADPATILDDDGQQSGPLDDDPSNGIDDPGVDEDGVDGEDAGTSSPDAAIEDPGDEDDAVAGTGDDGVVADPPTAGADDADIPVADDVSEEPSLFEDRLEQLEEAWSSEGTDGFQQIGDERSTADHDEVEDA